MGIQEQDFIYSNCKVVSISLFVLYFRFFKDENLYTVFAFNYFIVVDLSIFLFQNHQNTQVGIHPMNI